MCGCMPTHAAMDHGRGDPQPVQQTQAAPVALAPNTARRNCAHCGFPLQDSFAFCPSCGVNLRTAKCPACGQKVDPSWSSCAYCDSPLSDS
jgi:hypothetical protein